MAGLVWGSDSGRRIMAVIRAAFDSSKDQPAGVTVVAGYIADADQWQSIEQPWRNARTLAGLTNFHLTDIRRRFFNWEDVVLPFADIIKTANLRSVTSTLKDTDWALLDDDSAYRSLCPSREFACLHMFFDALAAEVRFGFHDEPVAVVFDNDWGGRRDAIVRIHDAWCKRTGHAGFDIFLKGGVPWDAVPLEASDLAAGLMRLDPFWKSRLDDKDALFKNNRIMDLASRALGNSRGVMWSAALAAKVESLKAERDAILREAFLRGTTGD
jgi:hypothetical protein